MFIVVLLVSNLFAQIDESVVKALFIKKFTLFVDDWCDKDSFFIITIYGKNDDFTNLMTKLVKSYKTTQIKKICIKTTNKISEIDSSSNIIFFSKNKIDEMEDYISDYSLKYKIIMSDTKGMAQKGSMFNLYINNRGNLRFEVNVNSLQKSKLKIDYKLLKYAKIIK